MDPSTFFIWLTYFLTILSPNSAIYNNGTDVQETQNNSVILSRRKRFIVFPEGSSFQLVFCLTFPMIFEIGDIFLYGYTAALAYELPQDPYSPFDHHADPLHRRADTKTIYFTDYKGKVLFKKPYKRKPIVNPAFAKRSVDGITYVNADQLKMGTAQEIKINRKQMHASQHKRDFLKSKHMEARSVEFHRTSRASLYGKIEALFRGHGADGKQCVLKTLCLIGQSQNNGQESFLQEIMRAVFTFPEHTSRNINDEYDEAYKASGPCKDLYPDCEDSQSDINLSSVAE